MNMQPKNFLEYASEMEANGNCHYTLFIGDYTVLEDCDGYSRGCTTILTCEYYHNDSVHKITLDGDSQALNGTPIRKAMEHLLSIKANGDFSIVNGGSPWERAAFDEEKYNAIMAL